MDISSFLNSFSPQAFSARNQPGQRTHDSQQHFAEMLARLSTDQAESGKHSALSGTLLPNTNPFSASPLLSDSPDLNVASLTQQVEGGDYSAETLQKLILAYEQERLRFLNSLISFSDTDADTLTSRFSF